MNRIKIDRFYRNVRLSLKDRFTTYLRENYGKNPTNEEKNKAAKEYFSKNLQIESITLDLDPNKTIPHKMFGFSAEKIINSLNKIDESSS